MLAADQVKQRVREEAFRLGFDDIGFSKARRLEDKERVLESWLLQGKQGTMQWMENHFDKRVDPTKLVPGAKTVISVIHNYFKPEAEPYYTTAHQPKMARYALGEDYHVVLKDKLFTLYHFIEELVGKVEGRAFVDSAPVLDKAWAEASGLGWFGKNGNLLNRKLGSWFFIGELIIDAVFPYDTPTTDHCGTCTKCIDLCPTKAIYEPGKIDSNRCISYLTIELREAIPEEYHEMMGHWLYGCDICQEVCPWNRKAPRSNEDRFNPNPELLTMNFFDWEELDLKGYKQLFQSSAAKRQKPDGFKRSLHAIKSNLKL